MGGSYPLQLLDYFFAIKASNVKPSKASLDAMDIMELAGRICGVALVNYYAVNKK